MKQQRLDGLADGIFAIVMTLLAFEMRLPLVTGSITDGSLWNSLQQVSSTFIIFVLSFALLFTYWRAHHFIVSVYAKSLTVGLANYNAIFFLFIILVPFSSSFLGTYWYTHVAIILYGLNVIAIGLTLFFMRRYVAKNPSIEKLDLRRDDIVSGYVRILFPVFSALLAIALGFYNPIISMILFGVAILFNLLPASTNWIHNKLVDATMVTVEYL